MQLVEVGMHASNHCQVQHGVQLLASVRQQGLGKPKDCDPDRERQQPRLVFFNRQSRVRQHDQEAKVRCQFIKQADFGFLCGMVQNAENRHRQKQMVVCGAFQMVCMYNNGRKETRGEVEHYCKIYNFYSKIH